MTDLNLAIELIENFKSDSLTKRLSELEKSIIGYDSQQVMNLCNSIGVDANLLDGAKFIKKMSAEIDVIIHSTGILSSLSSLLEDDEIIESTSLGAGNTGKKFDLETNLRIAEFKFIDWKGGPESIRQNGIFKDFFELAEYGTHKKKYLYVRGTETPLKFFNGGRALTSVLSRNPKALEKIKIKYGENVMRVKDYYNLKKHDVFIKDINTLLM